jgi:hypothetical protein
MNGGRVGSQSAIKEGVRGINGGNTAMQLELSPNDARLVRDLLHDYLPNLRREVARTEERTMRHELAQRQEACERLVQKLDGLNV